MSFSIPVIIQILQAIIASLPTAISTVEEVYALGQNLFATLNGTAPTAQQVSDLQKQIDADVAEALTPLPDDTSAT